VIAILGATGYVGRSLARHISAASDETLALFAREPARLAEESWRPSIALRDLASFDAGEFDLVINAIGPGEPSAVQALGGQVLEISECWDRRVLGTMGPHTRYVFLSSGAIYGAFERLANADTDLRLPINRLETVPPYTLAKLCAEARHRFDARAVLDLRIFAFADASISHAARFFLAELAACVSRQAPFRTSAADMVRDYAGAAELWDVVTCWIAVGAPNLAADLYSAAPASKFDILRASHDRFGLVIESDADDEGSSPAERVGKPGPLSASATKSKPIYASAYRIAETFGYRPRRTSLEIVLSVLDEVAARGHTRTPASGSGRRG
jgi:nucleoside-diphosphate-sugar epimerase